MTRSILDVTRLLTRAPHAAATGVDRVELAYARRAVADGGVGFAAIVGRRAAPLPREEVAAFVAALDAKWRIGRGDARAAARLSERLGVALPQPAAARGGRDEAGALALRLRLRAIAGLARPAASRGDVYVHVSHIRLDRPEPFARLRAEGARLTALVHDLIPIRFPEYARPGEDARHARRMTTLLTHATAVIANSADTARDLAAFAEERRLPTPPVTVAPLGLEASFRDAAPKPVAAQRPYFVALGTIEPRKNHLLLLHLWRRLAERLGDATPALVLVGRRGWENEMVVDLLERSPAIRAHVVEAADLDDLSLAALVTGARALLFPSFAEGYGLPLAEALALGAPAVVSDLAAFREVAGDAADALDPLDGPAWEQAVLDHLDDASPRRVAALARGRSYRAPDWAAHFAAVGELIGF